MMQSEPAIDPSCCALPPVIVSHQVGGTFERETCRETVGFPVTVLRQSPSPSLQSSNSRNDAQESTSSSEISARFIASSASTCSVIRASLCHTAAIHSLPSYHHLRPGIDSVTLKSPVNGDREWQAAGMGHCAFAYIDRRQQRLVFSAAVVVVTDDSLPACVDGVLGMDFIRLHGVVVGYTAGGQVLCFPD